MKWMIASDLHGSAYFTRLLLIQAEKELPEKLILLGDLLYHGPRNDLPAEYSPKQVISLLKSWADRLLCVRGNCDTEVDQMVLDFPLMADYAFLLLNGHMFFATHGHHIHPEAPIKMAEGTILLNGHTHIPKIHQYKDFLYVNPGSVSIPKENSPHSYLMLDGDTLQWKNLQGKIYLEQNLKVK